MSPLQLRLDFGVYNIETMWISPQVKNATSRTYLRQEHTSALKGLRSELRNTSRAQADTRYQLSLKISWRKSKTFGASRCTLYIGLINCLGSKRAFGARFTSFKSSPIGPYRRGGSYGWGVNLKATISPLPIPINTMALHSSPTTSIWSRKLDLFYIVFLSLLTFLALSTSSL